MNYSQLSTRMELHLTQTTSVATQLGHPNDSFHPREQSAIAYNFTHPSCLCLFACKLCRPCQQHYRPYSIGALTTDGIANREISPPTCSCKQHTPQVTLEGAQGKKRSLQPTIPLLQKWKSMAPRRAVGLGCEGNRLVAYYLPRDPRRPTEGWYPVEYHLGSLGKYGHNSLRKPQRFVSSFFIPPWTTALNQTWFSAANPAVRSLHYHYWKPQPAMGCSLRMVKNRLKQWRIITLLWLTAVPISPSLFRLRW